MYTVGHIVNELPAASNSKRTLDTSLWAICAFGGKPFCFLVAGVAESVWGLARKNAEADEEGGGGGRHAGQKGASGWSHDTSAFRSRRSTSADPSDGTCGEYS